MTTHVEEQAAALTEAFLLDTVFVVLVAGATLMDHHPVPIHGGVVVPQFHLGVIGQGR